MVANATLPEELILQIVTRAPIKAVGRCRCVSKRWRSLFSDPQFAKTHFQLAPKHQAVLLQHNSSMQLETLDFDSDNDTTWFEKESLVFRSLKSPFHHGRQFQDLCYCNGLVASYDFDSSEQGSFYIWNPTTGFFKKLPSRSNTSQDLIFGFGYVSTTDEYKVVMDAEIYSSKTDLWKQIDIPPPPPYNNMSTQSGVYFNSALHWLFYQDDPQNWPHVRVPYLYVFDLEKQEYSMMELPSALRSLSQKIDFDTQLGVTCGGCLYVMASRLVRKCGKGASYVDFWVMREYGNIDSWSRSFGVKIPKSPLYLGAISVMETSAFAMMYTFSRKEKRPMSTIYYRNEKENSGIYTVKRKVGVMVVYEESLCCLD